MTTPGESARAVRVREINDDEALLLGALHQQVRLLAGDGADDRTHVRVFAQAWHRRYADYPAFVAERGGQHVGVALVRRPVLPDLDRVPQLLVLAAVGEGAGDEGVCLALARAVVTWARDAGEGSLTVGERVDLPPVVLDAVRAGVQQARAVTVPTRP